MKNKVPGNQKKSENPVLQAIIQKTQRYIHIKWAVAALVLAAIIIYFSTQDLHLTVFLTTVAAICISIVTSLFLLYFIKSTNLQKWMIHLSLIIDFFLVVLAVYSSGSIVNTWVFFPVLIIFAASYLFAVRASLIYATAAYISIFLLFILEYFHVIPHMDTYGFPDNFYRLYPLYWKDALLGLFILYYVSALISGYLTYIMHRAIEKSHDRNEELKTEILKRQQIEEELKKHRDDLENLVKQRTEEIRLKNKQLIKEMDERKHAEEEKKRIEMQLQRVNRMEALGLLAGGVAHDLNNILAGVISYPDLILMNMSPDDELKEHIIKIQKAGQRAARVVADLLTLGQGIACDKMVLNLNSVIKNFLLSPEFKKLQSDNPSVSLSNYLEPDLFNIKCSRIHIIKSLMNLVINAFDALETHNDGEIHISTENICLEKPLQVYNEIPPGEYVVLKVADNGDGISGQDIERIFEPFYTKKILGRKGTGLGLTVVWNTIQDHNGFINVSSSEKGSRFELYFQATREKALEEQTGVSSEDIKGNGEKILVVDDEPLQREVACAILKKLGYKTDTVSGGEEAIEYLKKQPADLIIIDMIMDPGINGRKTFEQIVKINPQQKAIITSGYSETEEVRKTQVLGAGRFVKKPYTILQLGLAVKNELA